MTIEILQALIERSNGRFPVSMTLISEPSKFMEVVIGAVDATAVLSMPKHASGPITITPWAAISNIIIPE